jgi:hypothetical protein
LNIFFYQPPEMSMAHQLSVTQWKVEENGLLPEIGHVPVSQKKFLWLHFFVFDHIQWVPPWHHDMFYDYH